MLHPLTLVKVLMTPKLSLRSLPRPPSYLLFEPPASQPTMPQLLSVKYSFVHADLFKYRFDHAMSGFSLLYSPLGLENISHSPLLSSFPSYKIRYHHHHLQKDFLEPLGWVKFSSSLLPHCLVFLQYSTYQTYNNYLLLVFTPSRLLFFVPCVQLCLIHLNVPRS